MATTAHRTPVVKGTRGTSTPKNGPQGKSGARLDAVVDRTQGLSDVTIQALEDGARSAIEAVGRFAVTVEEALPQELQGTSEAAKKITESGLEMADRLVATQSDFLRKVVESAGDSLTARATR